MKSPRGNHFPTPPPLGDDFLRCAAARSLPQHALTWAFNPSAATLTGSPTPLRLPSGLCLTPPALTPCPAIIFFIPTSPTSSSKVRRKFFFFFSSRMAPFLVCVCASFFRHRSSQLDPALAQFPVGGQHNVQSPTRRGVYSAAVPGVMGAPEAPPPRSPRLLLATAAP